MDKNNKKKADQLGMPHGTASGRLRKMIIFKLLKKLGENFCFQCGAEIVDVKDLSIEHKIPWLDSEEPKELFFDLENVSFSHLSCNVAAARKTVIMKHPSIWAYQKGCRCDGCKDVEKNRRRAQRARGIKT